MSLPSAQRQADPVDAGQLWAAAQELLRLEIDASQFRNYVEPTLATMDSNETDLQLMAPDSTAADCLISHLERIEQLIGLPVLPGKIKVAVSNQRDLFTALETGGEVTPSAAPQPAAQLRPRPAAAAASAPATAEAKKPRKGPARGSGLSGRYHFQNFFSGPSNEEAMAAALKLATEDDGAELASPLFIYGSVGLGKSHLAHALGNHFCKLRPQSQVRLLSGEQFMREVQASFVGGRVNEFRQHFRKLDMVIIDDIQLIGPESGQTHKQIHALFNFMHEVSRPVVITSDRPAKELGNLPPRLLSRLTMGLDVVIDPPDQDTRVGILCYQARELFQIELDERVAAIIAARLHSNCRELVGALKRIWFQADLRGGGFTVETVRRVMGEYDIPSKEPDASDVVKKTADHFNLKTGDLRSKRRKKELVRARHIAMYLIRETTSMSLPAIADVFSCHHSSVMHALTKIASLLRQDPAVKSAVSKLRQELGR